MDAVTYRSICWIFTLSNFPFIINCRGRVLSLENPQIMGIINTTEDSFYAHNRSLDHKHLLSLAQEMVIAGATILDLGGMSTRPGSKEISVQQELDQLLPALEMIREQFPDIFISIDTYRSEVADQGIASGADIINDISGGFLDPKMPELVASSNIPYIIMHMRGTPQNMNDLVIYEDDILTEIISYFFRLKEAYLKIGINDLIIDPGFGFAKNIQHNYLILQRLSELSILDLPILIGVSRKGMFWRPLKLTPEEVLPATVAANFYALQQGAKILRVHDVSAAQQAIYVWSQISNSNDKFII